MLTEESENDALTEGWTYRLTDRHMDRQRDRRIIEGIFLNGGYSIIPHTLLSGGV